MRFCTTCGRNFDEDVDACPHDGTPLFDMGGAADASAEMPGADPIEAAAEASDAAAAELETAAEMDSDASDAVDHGVDAVEFELDDDDDDAPLDEVDMLVEAAEDMSEGSGAEEDDAPSEQIAAGIEDALDDMGPMTEDNLALAIEESETDDSPIVEPINTDHKKGGGGMGPIIIVLGLVAVVVVGFVMFSGNGAKEPPKAPSKDITKTDSPKGVAKAPDMGQPAAPDAGTAVASADAGAPDAALAANNPPDATEKDPVAQKPKPKPKPKPRPRPKPKPKPNKPDPNDEDPNQLLQQELLKLKGGEKPAEEKPAEETKKEETKNEEKEPAAKPEAEKVEEKKAEEKKAEEKKAEEKKAEEKPAVNSDSEDAAE